MIAQVQGKKKNNDNESPAGAPGWLTALRDVAVLNRFLPLVVFLVVAAIGLSMAATLHNSAEMARDARIDSLADDATDRIIGRFHQHLSLLQGTKSFFDATAGKVDRRAFRTYVAGLDTEGRYDGIQGIGFARFIRTGDEAPAEQEVADGYGLKRVIWPQTDQPYRTPIVLLEPDDKRNRAALAYDMYSDPVRRAAMTMAFETGKAFASAPVHLVQEITASKQAGFLVYIPFSTRGAGVGNGERLPLDGFIYAPFRAGDLYHAAIERSPSLPVAMKAYDRDAPDPILFQSEGFDEAADGGGYSTTREVEVAGRTWVFEIHSTKAFQAHQSNFIPLLIAAVAVLLAAALAASTRSQLKALASARALHELSQKSLQEKDLMLQEMKHRIKNSISRMLAIARQTAAGAESLDAFADSYSARLQAMANAQDALTRSHWQRADLKELLDKELQQVFGDDARNYAVAGPAVDLDEKATQALSLTFHELATNALKYGRVAETSALLSVHWDYTGAGEERALRLEWFENGGVPVEAPSRKGFGTRLIDANIVGELRGSIERNFTANGLVVVLKVPFPDAPKGGRRGRRGSA